MTDFSVQNTPSSFSFSHRYSFFTFLNFRDKNKFETVTVVYAELPTEQKKKTIPPHHPPPPAAFSGRLDLYRQQLSVTLGPWLCQAPEMPKMSGDTAELGVAEMGWGAGAQGTRAGKASCGRSAQLRLAD